MDAQSTWRPLEWGRSFAAGTRRGAATASPRAHGAAGPQQTAAASRRVSRWPFLLAFLIIVAAALVAAVGLFRPLPLEGDEGEYVALADAYRAGIGHRMINEPGMAVNMPAGPLLPLLLAPLRLSAAGGFVPSKVFVVTTFIVFAALFAFLLLRRFGPVTAALVGLTVVLSYNVAVYSSEVLTEIPLLLIVAAGMLAASNWHRGSRPRLWLLTMLACIALAYLLREAGIILGLSLLVWMLVQGRRREALLVLLVTVLVPLMWHAGLGWQVRRAGGATFGATHAVDPNIMAGDAADPPGVRVSQYLHSRPVIARDLVRRSLPELLRAARYYQRMWNGEFAGRVCSLASLGFLGLSVLGAVLLLRARDSDGLVGSFVICYLVMLLLYYSITRYLMPAYVFMVYAAAYALVRVNAARAAGRWSSARVYAMGAVGLVALHVVGLHAWNMWGEVRQVSLRRAGVYQVPGAENWPAREAAWVAAEWIGRSFPPKSQVVASIKPMNVYVLSHQWTQYYPPSTDLAAFTDALVQNHTSLILEDEFSEESIGPLRTVLAKGAGSEFRLLGTFTRGAGSARVWQFLPAWGRTASPPRQQPKQAAQSLAGREPAEAVASPGRVAALGPTGVGRGASNPAGGQGPGSAL